MKLVTKSLLCLAIFLPSFVLADVIYVNHAASALKSPNSLTVTALSGGIPPDHAP